MYRESDFRVDTFTDSFPLKMRITYLPTGDSIEQTGKIKYRLRQKIMDLLREKIEKEEE